MRFTHLLVVLLAGCGDNLTLPPDRDPAAEPEPQPLSCVPNLDSRIDEAELQPAIGTPVRYLVSPPGATRAVDLAGEENGAGVRLWDFATDFADDQALTVTPGTLTGKWYAAAFADGAFVTPFDRNGDLESVGLVRDGALLLLGLASAAEMPPEGQTLLVYEPPITVVQFPVTVGQSFVSTGAIADGVARGLPYAGQDTYEVSVDALGLVDLPQLTFEQVLRVRTKVTVEPAVGAAVVRQQTSFFAECFAEVVRAQSADGEASADFSQAAELRRLGY